MARKKSLRKLAKGQECLVRIPGYCNHNPETTVLCHIRRGGVAGIGQKPVDLSAVIACSHCHDVIDGRVPYPLENKDTFVLEGMCRTVTFFAKHLNVG